MNENEEMNAEDLEGALEDELTIDSYNNAIENCFEFIKNEQVVSATVSQKRFISKILKLQEKFPEEVKIIKYPEENDGYLYAKFPVSYLNISHKAYTEEQKEQMRKRLEEARSKKKG